LNEIVSASGNAYTASRHELAGTPAMAIFSKVSKEGPMPQWLRHHLLIVALATPVLFFGLGDARLWDRDEPRNA
jgi:hypothetical protein